MTNHLRAIDIKEYIKAIDMAREFADRAEKAEAAIRRVRELHVGSPECAHCFAERDGDPTPHTGYVAVITCDECAERWPCRTIRALDGDA